MTYTVLQESRSRQFCINGVQYEVLKTWYPLPDGSIYNFIHLYLIKEGKRFCTIKGWRWVDHLNGEVEYIILNADSERV